MGGGGGRGRGGGYEPGFTMSADWHQGATWGPRAFLRPWPAARRAAALQPGDQAGSSSGRELHGALGVITFSRTLKLIVP